MVVFAVVIAFTIAIINHVRITNETKENNEFQLERIEETVEYSLNTIDKAYYYFDEDVTERMKTYTYDLIQLYQHNSDIESWNLELLKEEFEMDLFFIDADNLIVHSTKSEDIGMDFDDCCGKLARILDERRASGEFFHDGIDIAQATGEVTKYSYMATPDKKYIVQLGYSLQDGDIFNDFNFLNVIEELEMTYPAVNEISTLNLGGIALGDPAGKSKLTPERKQAFEKTLSSGETTEFRDETTDETVIYRYIPYDSGYDFGSTQNKVIEIAYNDWELQTALRNHQNIFLIQLAFILVITIIIALIISRWAARPMYLAFHDNLTGLKNRTAFDEDIHRTLQETNGMTALLMIDFDHFKLVNDLFGHAAGDQFLKQMAQTIQTAVPSKDSVYRLGGDEFAVIMRNTDADESKQTAEEIMKSLVNAVDTSYNHLGFEVTASIGISFTQDGAISVKKLCKQADRALYGAKENGRNQYKIYDESDLSDMIS